MKQNNSQPQVQRDVKIKKDQKGFTIIELLIATAVFSLVLLVFLISFLRIGQLFYKGVSLSNTQETARTVLQDISDDLQFSNGQAPVMGSDYFCIGNHRYAYHLHQQVKDGDRTDYGIARESLTSCKPLTGPNAQPVNLSSYTELLDPGMQINNLALAPFNGALHVSIHIVFYGSDNSVLISSDPAYAGKEWEAPDAFCSGNVQSTQFCAVADYNSTILQTF
jgi:prepilin-type N-terminal cleavage/methylation domain-containing protein